MNIVHALPRAGRAWLAGTLVVLLAACDGGRATSPDGQALSARVSLSMSVLAAQGGGEADAYDAVDHVGILIHTQDGTPLYASQSSFDPSGSETRVPITVPLDGEIQAVLEVVLLRGSTPLFTGTANLHLVPSEVAVADLVLVPVGAGISVPDTLPPLVSIGETRVLEGEVLFATGDVAQSLHLQWTSLTPSVVSVQGSGASSTVVAVARGSGRLVASYGAFMKTVGITVTQVTAQVDVQPATTAVAAGGTVQLTATAQDAGGTPVPGAGTATWSTSDASVATVSTTGLVTGVGDGTATISAQIDGVTGQATVDVTAPPPVVQTLPADQIGPYDARLNATVDPKSTSTTAWFEWGTDPTLATSTATANIDVGSGTGATAISAGLGGSAQPNTTYYFRAVAQNGGGTTQGAIETFTTLPLSPPSVTVSSPSAVGLTTATVGGSVNPQGSATTGWVEWGTTSNLSQYTATTAVDMGSGTSPVPLSANLSGLANERTYYYRVAASNGAGTSRSSIASFTTQPPAPSNFNAGFDGPLYMNWTDNSTSETSFVVQRSTTSSTSGFTNVLTVGASSGTGTTVYAQEPAPFPAQVMWYRVLACNNTTCSVPSNVVQVTAYPPGIAGTLYLCYSSGTSNCVIYQTGITVTLSGASNATTTSSFGSYYFSGLVAGGTYTVSVSDQCDANFRTNAFTVTPGWGENVTVNFYADTLICIGVMNFRGRTSHPFDPVVGAILGVNASP